MLELPVFVTVSERVCLFPTCTLPKLRLARPDANVPDELLVLTPTQPNEKARPPASSMVPTTFRRRWLEQFAVVLSLVRLGIKFRSPVTMKIRRWLISIECKPIV